MVDRADRTLDLVLFGATSFVGRILCAYLVERHGTDGPLRWAIAGRDRARLDQVAEEVGADGPGTPLERIVVDATDAEGLRDMAGRTSVVVSTVGPYARYGSELVAAVAEVGTDYCDLTGEPQWMRRMIDAHHDTAVHSGARVLHACGFDSIPSDLGVWFTQQQASARWQEPCTEVQMQVRSMRGGPSGGTVASMLDLVQEAASDKAVRRLLADPYALVPAELRPSAPQPARRGVGRDRGSGQWLAPFVMAAVNTKVVHRTNALAGRPWGPAFRYDESMATGSSPLGALASLGVTAGVGIGTALAAVGPTRRLLQRVVPSPGEGPSPEAQARGNFELVFRGSTSDGRTITTSVTGDRDPGYGSTAKMLGEVAVLLGETPAATLGGGFWTPASAFGDVLVERLREHAGMGFREVGIGRDGSG
jgi:short subunit dehydrogenase-like uncharacterized protein